MTGPAHQRWLAVPAIGVLTTDQHGVVRHANAAAAALLGRGPDRVEGEPLPSLVAGDARSALRDLLARTRSLPRRGEEVGSVVGHVGDDLQVELSVATADSDRDLVTWLLLAPGAGRTGSGSPVSEGLVRLADLPVEGRTLAEVVRASLTVCGEVLGPGVQLTAHLGPPEDPESVVSTGALAQRLDGSQVQAGDGPTATAYREQTTVWAADARADPRWPGWAAGVAERDLAVVAVPLRGSGRTVGVLTAYGLGESADASLAGHVETLALVVRGRLQEVALRGEIDRAAQDRDRALASRAVIDQAKGVVMARRGCSPDEAFQHLVDLASTRHEKLRRVAAEIVADVSGQRPAVDGAVD